MPRHVANDLFLCTTLARSSATGAATEYDMRVRFDAEMIRSGRRATSMHPAEEPDIEVAFTGAEFEREPDDASGLTAIETATLRAWFEANIDAALTAANDNLQGG